MRRALGLVALLALMSACAPQPYVMRGTMREPSTTVPDLVLSDTRGVAFHFSELRDRVTLIYFGFTSCPDLCPTTLVDLAQVKKKLGADAAHLTLAFITLDPERDTPGTLARYVALFDPAIVALTGTADQLTAARTAFGVTATKRDLPASALGYTIDHSSLVYVIDARGRWSAQFEHGTPVDDMVGDVRELIRKAGT